VEEFIIILLLKQVLEAGPEEAKAEPQIQAGPVTPAALVED
jgi:hypothetical protein